VRPLRARLAAEALGTFALVFAGCGAIVADGASGGAVTHVGVSLVFGLVVLAVIQAFGGVSGAHVNPAVTLAFCAAGRFPARHVLPYVLAQGAGGVGAALALSAIFPVHPTLGATIPSGSFAQSFALEVVLTWFLMLVILRVSAGSRETGLLAGVAIGAVVALEACIGGPISGASMNPARSLAPALVSLHLEHLHLYLAAPVLGALLAVPTCRLVGSGPCCAPTATSPTPTEPR
jgi:aquaporin NIP